MRFATAIVAITLVVGCKSKTPDAAAETTEAVQSRITERLLESEGLIQQEVDLDIDGKPDIINYYRERTTGRLLVKKELDLNKDGTVDLVSQFDEDGRLELEMMDSDYDGNFDWTDHYQDGRRVMSEYDTETDGVANVFKYYETVEGKTYLARKERDTNGDGRIDVWERFDNEGNVIRTGRDTDGDGKMDERSE